VETALGSVPGGRSSRVTAGDGVRLDSPSSLDTLDRDSASSLLDDEP